MNALQLPQINETWCLPQSVTEGLDAGTPLVFRAIERQLVATQHKNLEVRKVLDGIGELHQSVRAKINVV
jgi:hypothetical protein